MQKKNLKRIIACMFALILIFSMCISTFAASDQKGIGSEQTIGETMESDLFSNTEFQEESQTPDIENKNDTDATKDTHDIEDVTEKDDVSKSTIEADIYIDEQYTEKLNTGDNILIEGMFEKGVSAKAYPVSDACENAIIAYDITLFDEDGNVIQPEKSVLVSISNKEIQETIDEGREINVIHISDDGKTEDIEDVKCGDKGIEFNADSFSVYAVVPGPEPIEITPETISDLSALTDKDGYYLSVTRGTANNYYFTNTLSNVNCFNVVTNMSAASIWYFEEAGAENLFYVYTMVNGEKKYIKNTSGNLVGLVEKNNGEALFEISVENDRFLLKLKDEDKWLQYSNSGKGIRFWTDMDNAGNSRITATAVSSLSVGDDEYKLDGKTYGLMNMTASTSGEAIMGSEKNGDALNTKTLQARQNPLDSSETLYVAKDSDIAMWTFHLAHNDFYTVSTVIDGVEKYLKLDSNGIHCVTEENASEIQVIPGTGSNNGKLALKTGSIAVSNEGNNGFKTAAFNESSNKFWFNLTELSDLTEEDFVHYSATKASVSDTEQITNGSRVIIYTRVWDDQQKQYQFYAVDHNGGLVPCYERGGSIEWTGSKINTLLWNFVEYHNEGTNIPNYYYELYNQYSKKYIAPQIGNNQILSDKPIGINLNGRRYGDYYSQIIAWDDPYYAYAGLKTENGHIVSCPYAQVEDFYFAIMDEEMTDDVLHEIDTIDHTQFGITMKMVDFDTNSVQNTFLGSTAGGAVKTTVPGLLSTQLGADGYPTNSNGVSLGTLYAGAQEVNHLFSESTYRGSGYYEFDSTQNFASLQQGGNFKVYREIATHDEGNKPSLKHGQFYPYNDISPGVYASVNKENLYTATVEPLPDSAPWKYEPLHLIAQPDYYFGLEIEAGFTQTTNGLDAWGHDIIYEFTGDDDFWLYVDGELVLDLGGLHSALPGSVNFSTGEVNENGHNTSLYQIFRNNYVQRNPSATNAQIEAYLNDKFELNDNGQYVFKDYSTHTMKIFFMERGASASNLHMRFNLSSIKPGQIMLNKQISGTDDLDYKMAEYGYQIWYQTEEDGPYVRLNEETETSSHINVTYQNTNIPVKFRKRFTPAGSQTEYEDVFFLTPSQTVVVSMPDETINYYIVECGVNTQVYDKVSINDVETTGTQNGVGRMDYETTKAPVTERQRVVFDNHVSEDAKRTLTITKRLYDVENNEITNDPTGFNFRLYLGNENDTVLSAASLQNYYVKAPNGTYCRWNSQNQAFESINISDFSLLTDEQKEQITFQTSMHGAISKIPAGYKVEVRDLLIGTKFRVEERESEMPLGYSFIEYVRDGASYVIEDGDTINSGRIRENESPAIEVHNRRGFGIQANKEWSDSSYMDNHGDTYFAVYVNGSLLDGSIRRLHHPASGTRYYWNELLENASLADYTVREVRIDGDYTTDETTGIVTPGPDAVITPIDEDGQIQINAKAKTDDEAKPYGYIANYHVGSIGGTNNNIRTDTITNTRSGIRLIKQDFAGNPVANAKFTLTEPDGSTVGLDVYTSDENGLITIAYVNAGTIYTLTETKTPTGYQGLTQEIKFRLNRDGSITVTSGDSEQYELSQASGNEMASIVVKNRPFEFKAIKTETLDNGSQAALSGAHFALYREVTVGGITTMDYNPIPGMEDLVSATESGRIPGIDQTLSPGAYYLKETGAPEEYRLLQSPIRFTISETGVVALDQTGDAELTSETGTNGKITYTLNIKNEKKIVVPSGFTPKKIPFVLFMVFGVAMLFMLNQKKQKT